MPAAALKSKIELIEELFMENPGVTYGEIAEKLDMTVFEVIAVIDAAMPTDTLD